METLSIIISAIIAITFAKLIWDLIIGFFNIFTGSYKNKEMSDTYVTLDEFFNEDRKAIKQVVYKVEGDFNGDIKGDNVTVILMGNGNFNGDISSKDGEVVLIKGSINGDVKANKIVCPTEPTNKVRPNCRMCECYMCEGVITGQIYCYKHGLLNDPVPCSDFVKRDQL